MPSSEPRTFFILSYDDERRRTLATICQDAAAGALVREAFDLSDLVMRIAASRNAVVVFDLASLPRMSRVVTGMLRGVARRVQLIGVRGTQPAEAMFDRLLDCSELAQWIRQGQTELA